MILGQVRLRLFKDAPGHITLDSTGNHHRSLRGNYCRVGSRGLSGVQDWPYEDGLVG